MRFGAVFGPKFSQNFRGRKILRSKSREIGSDRARILAAWWCTSFVTTLRGPAHLLRASACCAARDYVRFGADFGPKFSQNFRGRKILRSKSREIGSDRARILAAWWCTSFVTTLRGPAQLLRASACCAARDFGRFATAFGPIRKCFAKFSRLQNFAF